MAATTDPVDLALVLATDVSSSADSGDYILQMRGISAALTNPLLASAIALGRHKRIALSVVHWSTREHQEVAVPWTILSTARDLATMAGIIEHLERRWTPGGTGLAAAISFCAALVLSLKIDAGERMIDVSGDGQDNEEGNVALARDEAVALGVVINGLPITSGSPSLTNYYTRNVMGGADSFVLPARNILDYANAMKEKLLREVGTHTS